MFTVGNAIALAVSAYLWSQKAITEIERRLQGNPNLEGIALRYGFFYGPGTWFAPDGDVAQQVRQQQFPIVGNGEGVWSWVHIEDAAIAQSAVPEAIATDMNPREGEFAEMLKKQFMALPRYRTVEEIAGMVAYQKELRTHRSGVIYERRIGRDNLSARLYN